MTITPGRVPDSLGRARYPSIDEAGPSKVTDAAVTSGSFAGTDSLCPVPPTVGGVLGCDDPADVDGAVVLDAVDDVVVAELDESSLLHAARNELAAPTDPQTAR